MANGISSGDNAWRRIAVDAMSEADRAKSANIGSDMNSMINRAIENADNIQRAIDDSIEDAKEAAKPTALDYVNTRLRSDRKYIFVGHSKGGMEALYAGLLYEKYQHNVLEIISLDGPGFVDSILETLNKSPYKHKARLIVPDGSVVGRIFKQPIDYTIVYSNEYGLLQHNPLSWKILGHEFGVVPSFREGTEKLSKTINETAATFSVEELKEFEKDFFDTLSSGGSKCLLDTPFHFFSIQKAFVSLSLKQKKLFLKFMSYIIDSRLVSKDIMFPSIRIKYNKDKQD